MTRNPGRRWATLAVASLLAVACEDPGPQKGGEEGGGPRRGGTVVTAFVADLDGERVARDIRHRRLPRRVAEHRAGRVRVLARDAADRERVPAVGRDIDLDRRVVEPEFPLDTNYGEPGDDDVIDTDSLRFQVLCGTLLYSRSDLPNPCGGSANADNSGALLVTPGTDADGDHDGQPFRDPDSPGVLDLFPWWAEYLVDFSDGERLIEEAYHLALRALDALEADPGRQRRRRWWRRLAS